MQVKCAIYVYYRYTYRQVGQVQSTGTTGTLINKYLQMRFHRYYRYTYRQVGKGEVYNLQVPPVHLLTGICR